MRAAGPPFGIASQPIAASFFGSDYRFNCGGVFAYRLSISFKDRSKLCSALIWTFCCWVMS